jgi:hypothetical protein
LAIFVIVAGVLLMLGGAAALLFGFDIVMTERGTAMVIGGTVTLSGGAIAIGVGFALVKLNQILRALDLKNSKTKNDKTQHSTSSGDRPIVPTPITENVAPSQAGLAQTSSATLAGIAVASVAVTGVALAGVAAVGNSIVSKSNSDPHPFDDAHPSDLDAIALAVETPAVNNEPYSNASPTALVSSPDLEAELSRALAETENNADQDRQFTAGLSEFLSKPKTDISDVSFVDPADENLSQEGAALGGIELTDAETSDSGDKELGRDAALPSEVLGSVEGEDTTEGDNSELSGLNLDFPQDETASDEDNHVSSDQAETLHDGTAQETDILRPGILRTYNAGGKFYTIYVDGTVEATTNNGVKRFVSMDEFRAHLTNG